MASYLEALENLANNSEEEVGNLIIKLYQKMKTMYQWSQSKIYKMIIKNFLKKLRNRQIRIF